VLAHRVLACKELFTFTNFTCTQLEITPNSYCMTKFVAEIYWHKFAQKMLIKFAHGHSQVRKVNLKRIQEHSEENQSFPTWGT